MKHLGVFAKYWEPGKVKTRLAATIGDQSASELQRSFVTTLLRRFRNVADRRVLAFTPAERRLEFDLICEGNWLLEPQSAGNLGARMKRFFLDQLSSPQIRVVLIGSDSPTLPADIIHRAFDELRDSPAVLGPSTDGGYYLIGLTGKVPDMFSDIDWGSPFVWRQTIARLAKTNTPFVELPPWYDVDHLDDLRRLERDVQDLVAVDSHWSDLADQLRRVLTSVG